jgi:hypothetical protein
MSLKSGLPGRKFVSLFSTNTLKGLLLPFLEPVLKTDTARGFTEMNEALWMRAEQLAGTVP